MSPLSNPKIIQSKHASILFDTSILEKPNACFFDNDCLNQHAELRPTASGRGASWFVNYQQQQWVLRHYLRGGMMAKFIHNRYFALNAETTRSWQEWRLLQYMQSNQLPVPRPIAAWAEWPWGRYTGVYRAAILLEQIPHCQTLDKILQQRALTNPDWQQLGQCIRRFHQHHIHHADLNANNILLTEESGFFLIDFDRGAICQNQQALSDNLSRLQRSLHKQKQIHADYYFSEVNWQQLMIGYNDSKS